MKRFIVAFALLAMGSLGAQAEEQQPALGTFDKCNNWARHYCQSGNHENAVNRALLRLKKAGIPITQTRIRMLAQKIRPNTQLPTQ